jgi:hypothetical protein
MGQAPPFTVARATHVSVWMLFAHEIDGSRNERYDDKAKENRHAEPGP